MVYIDSQNIINLRQGVFFSSSFCTILCPRVFATHNEPIARRGLSLYCTLYNVHGLKHFVFRGGRGD